MSLEPGDPSASAAGVPDQHFALWSGRCWACRDASMRIERVQARSGVCLG